MKIQTTTTTDPAFYFREYERIWVSDEGSVISQKVTPWGLTWISEYWVRLCYFGQIVCTQTKKDIMDHDWHNVTIWENHFFSCPRLIFTHWSLFLRACHGVRASEAGGIGALTGVRMGNNQMDQLRDNRDLFLAVVTLPFSPPLTVRCPSLCLHFFLPRRRLMGVDTECGTHITQKKREKYSISPIWKPRHRSGFWQQHLSKSTEAASWH